VIKLALAKRPGSAATVRDERMTAAAEHDAEAKSATTHYAVMGAAADEFAWVCA
jgi:hypothetical protein